MQMIRTKHATAIIVCSLALFAALFPLTTSATGGSCYSQGAYYSQSYYQSTYYSQAYYQAVYYSQGSYQTTITVPTTLSSTFTVTNAISKAAGTFVIDSPLDPANKLLFHSFVESPDVKNVYDGLAVLDKNGEATIRLPLYFDALNKDVRYQLKPVDRPMPDLHVKEEVQNNQFSVAGGVPGGKISWQVTGIRHDPYILANPVIPEVEKGPKALVDKGDYLFPGSAPKCSNIVWCLWSF